MPAERPRAATAKAELSRDELCAAARYTLHLAGERTIALGDQVVICRSREELADELGNIRALLDRAEGVFAFAEGLEDSSTRKRA
jgi:hypothetical protein